jgi:hypothetical protein
MPVIIGKSEGKAPTGRPNVDVSTLLKWILRKQGLRMWTEFNTVMNLGVP